MTQTHVSSRQDHLAALRAAARADGWYEFQPGQEARCPGERRLSQAPTRAPEPCAAFVMEAGHDTVIKVRVDQRDGQSRRQSGGHPPPCEKCGARLVIRTDIVQSPAA